MELAKDMRAAQERGEKLGLTPDELTFYDALEVNDSAVKVLGDETLRLIARELVETMCNNVSDEYGASTSGAAVGLVGSGQAKWRAARRARLASG